MTVRYCIEDFMLEQQVRGHTAKTLDYYKNCLKQFSVFVGEETEMDKISQKTLREYSLSLQKRGISSTSVQTYIRGLRAFLTHCYREEYISEDLSKKFRLPKAKRKEIDVLTDNEVKEVFNYFDINTFLGLRNYCLCALMLDSGLRMNEAVTLTMENLHIAERYAIVDGKGNKQRMIPIGNKNCRMLLKYTRKRASIAGTNRVFVNSQGEPIKQATVKQLFRKMKKDLLIPRLRPHLLRHTFATRYLENGGDMYTLQQILGHTSLEMVKKYVHLTNQKTVMNFPNYSPLDKLR